MIPFDFTRPWGLLALLALVPVVYLAISTRLRLVQHLERFFVAPDEEGVDDGLRLQLPQPQLLRGRL